MTLHKREDYTIDAPDLGTPLDMGDIRSLADRAGSHYFERGAMRFFRSRIGDKVITRPEGWYFVTSEQFVGSSGIPSARKYTLRKAHYRTDEQGRSWFAIDTVGEFNVCRTSREAWRQLPH